MQLSSSNIASIFCVRDLVVVKVWYLPQSTQKLSLVCVPYAAFKVLQFSVSDFDMSSDWWTVGFIEMEQWDSPCWDCFFQFSSWLHSSSVSGVLRGGGFSAPSAILGMSMNMKLALIEKA